MRQDRRASRQGKGGSPNRPQRQVRLGPIEVNRPYLRSTFAFALYEVLLGLAIFAIGVLALGRAVQNCLTASTLNAEEDRVRQILSNRMAEVQATPGPPDNAREFKIDTGYGIVRMVQNSATADFKDEYGAQLNGGRLVDMSAYWTGV